MLCSAIDCGTLIIYCFQERVFVGADIYIILRSFRQATTLHNVNINITRTIWGASYMCLTNITTQTNCILTNLVSRASDGVFQI